MLQHERIKECLNLLSQIWDEMKKGYVDEDIGLHQELYCPKRPTGKWIEIKSSCDLGHKFYHCSVCNRFLDVMAADGETLEDYPFCHCGADMRSES